MVVLLVLALFAIALTADYLISVRKGNVVDAVVAEPRRVEPAPLSLVAGGFHIKPDFHYHPGHTWAVAETPELVRVGLDDFVARVAGSLKEMTLPSRGQWIRQGQRVVGLGADGRHFALVSPVEGVVVDVNEKVLEEPNVARHDPYGEGWLLKVSAPDFRTVGRNLLTGSIARRWMEDAGARLRAMMAGPVPVTAYDGGVAVDDLAELLPEEVRATLGKEFFLE